jgi:hypothetical protein
MNGQYVLCVHEYSADYQSSDQRLRGPSSEVVTAMNPNEVSPEPLLRLREDREMIAGELKSLQPRHGCYIWQLPKMRLPVVCCSLFTQAAVHVAELLTSLS